MRTDFLVALLISAAIGVVAGSFSSSPASAATWEYWINLPAGADNTLIQLRCGWHNTACPNGTTKSLDWGTPNNNNLNIYFRGAGKAPVGTITIGGHMQVTAQSGYGSTCQWNLVSTVRNFFTGTVQMRMVYVHGKDPYANGNLWYRNPTYVNPSIKVGVMATTSDPLGCGWGGTHVHAGAENAGVSVARNTGFPNNVAYSPPYPTHNNLTWQHYFSFNQ